MNYMKAEHMQSPFMMVGSCTCPRQLAGEHPHVENENRL
jgi:hypothetical protein